MNLTFGEILDKFDEYLTNGNIDGMYELLKHEKDVILGLFNRYLEIASSDDKKESIKEFLLKIIEKEKNEVNNLDLLSKRLEDFYSHSELKVLIPDVFKIYWPILYREKPYTILAYINKFNDVYPDIIKDFLSDKNIVNLIFQLIEEVIEEYEDLSTSKQDYVREIIRVIVNLLKENNVSISNELYYKLKSILKIDYEGPKEKEIVTELDLESLIEFINNFIEDFDNFVNALVNTYKDYFKFFTNKNIENTINNNKQNAKNSLETIKININKILLDFYEQIDLDKITKDIEQTIITLFKLPLLDLFRYIFIIEIIKSYRFFVRANLEKQLNKVDEKFFPISDWDLHFKDLIDFVFNISALNIKIQKTYIGFIFKVADFYVYFDHYKSKTLFSQIPNVIGSIHDIAEKFYMNANFRNRFLDKPYFKYYKNTYNKDYDIVLHYKNINMDSIKLADLIHTALISPRLSYIIREHLKVPISTFYNSLATYRIKKYKNISEEEQKYIDNLLDKIDEFIKKNKEFADNNTIEDLIEIFNQERSMVEQKERDFEESSLEDILSTFNRDLIRIEPKDETSIHQF